MPARPFSRPPRPSSASTRLFSPSTRLFRRDFTCAARPRTRDFPPGFTPPGFTPSGFTLVELAIALVLIAALVAILLPSLSTARATARLEQCADNQRTIGTAWHAYLHDHDQQFPEVPVQPSWFYGGMKFSALESQCWPDYDRPLTSYMSLERGPASGEHAVCRCPADHGISDPHVEIGTGRRTAFRSYGTSYCANGVLLNTARAGDALDDSSHSDLNHVDSSQGDPGHLDRAQAGADINAPLSLNRRAIATEPSRLVLMGDPAWYETANQTGRHADWHGAVNVGNILFLDGAVKRMTIRPRTDRNQPLIFDPVLVTDLPGVDDVDEGAAAPGAISPAHLPQ